MLLSEYLRSYSCLEGIDAILTLGGEPKDTRPRSKATGDIYNLFAPHRENPLWVVLSGYCSGLSDVRPSKEQSESAGMKSYLLARDVPEQVIRTEDNSMHTLANFVYSQPILDRLNAKRIAVVVDNFGLPRAMETGKYVLGKKYDLRPFGVDEPAGSNLVERAVRLANMLDISYVSRLYRCHPESGDNHSFQRYLQEMDAFHSQNFKRYFTFFGLGVLAMKALNR